MNKKVILIIVLAIGILLLIPIGYLSIPFVKKIYLEYTHANNEEELKSFMISTIFIPEENRKDTILFRNGYFICGNSAYLEIPVSLPLPELKSEIRSAKGIQLFDEDEYFHTLDSLMNRQPFYNEEARRIDSLKHKDYLRLAVYALKISNSEVHLNYTLYSNKGNYNETFLYYFFYKNGQWSFERKNV